MPRITKAQIEAERIRKHAVMQALVWPSYARPVPITAEEIRAATNGKAYAMEMWFQNVHTLRVTRGWSTYTTHCTDWGQRPLPANWQATRDLGSVSRDHARGGYRTELQAWHAMRWEATEQAAEDLYRIDQLKFPVQLREGQR